MRESYFEQFVSHGYVDHFYHELQGLHEIHFVFSHRSYAW